METLNPLQHTEGFSPVKIGEIRLSGHIGTLYEFGCKTHSDVGLSHKTIRLWLASNDLAVSFNLSNPNLALKADAFIPKPSSHPYEIIDLKGFVAIFDIKPKVKVVLYGNGTNHTLDVLKADLLAAIKSCEIIEV